MTARVAHLTDGEFAQLIGESPLWFTARMRAEAAARDLRERASAVAADLRRWIVAGEVADPSSVARIAGDFDCLARELETEVARPDFTHWMDGSREYPDNSGFLRSARTDDYEIEAWHSVAEPHRGVACG